MLRIGWIIAALMVWAILTWAFVFVFAGGHVCHILQPVAVGDGPTPTPRDLASMMADCNRPDIGAIAASVLGLVTIVVAVVATRGHKPAGT